MPRLWAQLTRAGASEAPRAATVDPGMDVDSEGGCLSSLLSVVHTACISKYSPYLRVAISHAECDCVALSQYNFASSHNQGISWSLLQLLSLVPSHLDHMLTFVNIFQRPVNLYTWISAHI